jgi:DNA primase
LGWSTSRDHRWSTSRDPEQGPHRGVWNLDAVKSSKEVILCESIIDAATFWCAGIRNVTCSYGVGGFTDDHVAAFEQHGVERVMIAYDRDEAGDKAAEALAKKLNALGIETARVLFPKGMDANAYALKVGPAEKSLRVALANAVWTGKGRAVAVPSASSASASAASSCPTPPATSSGCEASDGVDARTPEASKEESFSDLVAEAGPSRAGGAAELEPAEKLSSLAAEQASGAERVSAEDGAEPTQVSADELVLVFGDRRWRIRGLGKNTALSALRVNVLVSRGEAFHVDSLELYSARQRTAFIGQAREELGVEERVIKGDLGRVLLKLEELQEQQLKEDKSPASKAVELSESEQREALALLKSPKLLERILEDFERSGVIGERVNKLVGYLAATSRKLERPLAVVIQSTSAAGKSSLMEAVLSFVPEEERCQYSAMTERSLFYMGGQDLKHKVLAIAEEEGAREASYALKLLQSEGRVKIASTGKDARTGEFETREYELEGPVMVFLTTTAIDVDEELLNRCLVLSVDEGREQTRAIHAAQRQARTLEGLVASQERERLRRLHQNAQRLLRPLAVVNPYAAELRFPDHQTRARRDHTKYLAMIDVVALLHQYQREVKEVERCVFGSEAAGSAKVRYIEVTREDIAVADQLCAEVLGRTMDELPPGTRRLLLSIDRLVTERSEQLGMDRNDYRFSRREVREWTRMGLTQLRVHLERLVEMEYVIAHGSRGRGSQYLYELAWFAELEVLSSKLDDGLAIRLDDGRAL